nr:uncharacterized protein LOC107438688 [Parasteatoda tepidariorum]
MFINQFQMFVLTETNCQDGALVGVGRGLERGISGITNNAEGVISDVTLHGNLLGVAGDAVDHVGHAAQGLIDNVDHGLGNGIDDLACGIGKDADEIAEGVQTGDILGGLADVAGSKYFRLFSTIS